MISQKESSTEYNPFVVPTRNDAFDAMSYVSHADLTLARQQNSLLEEIDYLKDVVRILRFELWELKDLVKEKGIMFEDSCDEKYAEDWRKI